MTLKIYEGDGEFAVWIEPEPDAVHIGLCAGVGKTKAEALDDAAEGLENLLRELVAKQLTQ